MKAETRTLVAIFLIVLISIVSYRFLPRSKTQSPTPVVSEEPLPEEPVVEPEIAPEPERMVSAKTPGVEEDSVVVDTDLFRISFSTVGGSIRSLLLRQYPDLALEDDEEVRPAELIPEGRRAVLTSVRTPDTTYDLSGANFAIEKVVLPTGADVGEVVFSAPLPNGNTLSKAYTFRNGTYIVGLKEVCSGDVRELRLDWGAGLRQTEKAQKWYLQYFSAMAMVGGIFKQWQMSKILKALRSGELEKVRDLEYVGRVDWAAVKTKYFIACFIPKEEVRYFKIDTVGPSELSVRLASEGRLAEYDMYIGPLQYDRLKSFGLGLERAVYLGPGWVSGISRLILRILVWLQGLVKNYGLVIIIFSCIMMIIFYPLTYRSLRSMREMQKLQPKIAAMRQKYEKDKQRLNQETMGLYKKEGINPLGGCLPLVFQMPVFWALFAILRSTIEMRGAHFLWIGDLSERDPFFILPVLMAGSMFLQQKFTVTDPRQKMMSYMMPLVMLFIFWNFPAGLVLYWLTYNVLSVLQHYLLHRKKDEAKEAPS